MERWGKVTLAAKHSETDTSVFEDLMEQPKEYGLDIGTSGTTTTVAESSSGPMLVKLVLGTMDGVDYVCMEWDAHSQMARTLWRC